MSTSIDTIVTAIEEILKTLRHSVTVPHLQDISSITILHTTLQDAAQAFIRTIGPVDNAEAPIEFNVEAPGSPRAEAPATKSSCLKRPREDDDEAETGPQSPSGYKFTSPSVLVDKPIDSSDDESRGRTLSRPKKRQRFAEGIPSPPPRHGRYLRIRRNRDTRGIPLDSVHLPSGAYHRSTRPMNGDDGIPREIILVTTDPDMLALRRALLTTLSKPEFIPNFLRFAETYEPEDTDELESPPERTTADGESPSVDSVEPRPASPFPSRGRGPSVRMCPLSVRKTAKKNK